MYPTCSEPSVRCGSADTLAADLSTPSLRICRHPRCRFVATRTRSDPDQSDDDLGARGQPADGDTRIWPDCDVSLTPLAGQGGTRRRA